MFDKFNRINRMAVVSAFFVAIGATSALSAYAADDVTVMLRSGERVSGQLEDLNRGTLFVRVSLNDQRRVPVGDVAVIDFVGGATGLPETETGPAADSDHLLVLRNSQLVKGRLVDIEGGEGSDKPTEPRLFIFKTSSGDERRVPVGQVGRVYMGQFTGGQGAATNASGATMPESATGVRVQANQAWTSAGITVVEGQTVSFAVQGEAQLSSAGNDRASAAGAASGRRAERAPLPTVLAGALIGRIGPNGAPFGIGNQTAVAMPASGQLFLGINDDEVSDNSGGYVVDVKPQLQPGVPRRRR